MLMLDQWIRHGEAVRDGVNDDRLLIAGLRALLPQYEGPSIALFRGETMWNHRRRSYGVSWSAEEAVADCFAQGDCRAVEGGSVLLRVMAPPDAIICDTRIFPQHRDYEAEVIVDRRLLRGLTILRPYPQAEVAAFHERP